MDGKSHPVVFVSRCYSGAETKLDSSEDELLVLIFRVTKFYHYLSINHFIAVTENSTLRHLHKSKGKNPKLVRWAKLLSNYDFTIKYKPSISHANTDRLSCTN